MARRLVAGGHTVTLITGTHAPSEVDPEITSSGISIIYLGVPYSSEMSYTRRILSFCYFAVAASRVGATVPADVVYASSTPLTVAIPAIWSAKRRRVSMVFEVRDLWPEVPIALGALRNPVVRWVAQRLADVAYEKASKIVALSPDMADGVCLRGVDPAKVSIIPNGCDLELFSSSTEQPPPEVKHIFDHKRVVLYPGAFGRVNGLEWLIEVAAETNRQNGDIRFVLIGTGPREDDLRELAARRGILGECVFFLDPIAKNAMPYLFNHSGAVISTVADVPELSANSANKVFDALASGRPVIVNHEGWLAGVIRDSGSGLVLPRNVPKAASQLVSFMGDQETLVQAGKAALHLARTRFNRDNQAEMLEILLEAAIGSRE